MVVIHKQDNKIIAATGFNDKSYFEKGFYEIGYWCDSYYQGKGYVTEYANALTRYAFEELEAFKVVIAMQIDNKKSIAVAKRLNFICAGTEARDPSEYVASLKPLSYLHTIAGVATLSELFANLLKDVEFLKYDGLTSADLSKLNRLLPKIKLLC